MPGHPLGQAMADAQGGVESVGEELEKRDVAVADAINVVGPVDQQSAPHHEGEQRHVDPMEPADRSRVLPFQGFHPLAASLRRDRRHGCAGSPVGPRGNKRRYFLSSILSLPILSVILSSVLPPILLSILSPILSPILSSILPPILSPPAFVVGAPQPTAPIPRANAIKPALRTQTKRFIVNFSRRTEILRAMTVSPRTSRARQHGLAPHCYGAS